MSDLKVRLRESAEYWMYEVATRKEAAGRIEALEAENEELLTALQGLLCAVQRSVCAGSGPAQDQAHAAIAKAVRSREQ